MPLTARRAGGIPKPDTPADARLGFGFGTVGFLFGTARLGAGALTAGGSVYVELPGIQTSRFKDTGTLITNQYRFV